jgi:prephenate dehydrogenase
MRSAAVIGTGLIGTSVALALTGQGVTTYLLDRDPEAARTAAALGAGLAATPRAPVDLAVVAVPPGHTASVLKEYQHRMLARFFTDVASVKMRPLMDAASAGCDLTRYVGGHPMAGRELSGPLAARADLFQGRTWVLTPSAFSRAEALHYATELIELCGGQPVIMGHAEHDRAVALTSHAPHLVASLLAGRLLGADTAQLRLVGKGLRDATRIAAGDAGLWADIIGSNAGPVARVLAELAEELGAVVAALRELDDSAERPRGKGAAELLAALARGEEGRSLIVAAERPADAAQAAR